MRSSPRAPASGGSASPYAQPPGSVGIGAVATPQQSKGSASPRLFPALHSHQHQHQRGNTSGSHAPSITSLQQQQQLQQSPAASPERGGHSGGQSQEWLNSPRTHRMLQLLGVAPSPSPPSSGNAMVRRPSDPQLSPHPPSFKPQQPYSPSPYSPRSGGSLEEKQSEWRDGSLDDSYGSLANASHPKMFLPVAGMRRFYRAQASAISSGAAGVQAGRPIPSPPGSGRRNNGPRRVGGIPPQGPPAGALTLFSPSSNAPAPTSPSHASAAMAPRFTSAERQLVLDYLTSDACGLFTPPSDDEDAEEHRDRQDITEAHLDALLTLCSDAPSVIRQLRSLDRQHLRFADIFTLISGVDVIVARKAAMLAWMLGQDPPEAGHQECHLFGQSPFVVFLNSQAMDRLVEESMAWKLAQLPPPADPNADPSQPSPPQQPQPQQPQLPTQPFDDVFHILLRLNESSSKQGEFHYFSQLITHVRRVVEGVLANQGYPVESSVGSHGHAAQQQQQQEPQLQLQLQEETPRFKRVGGKAPSTSTRAAAASAAAAACRSRAKMPLRGPSARSLLASPTYGKKGASASASTALAPMPAEEKREFGEEEAPSGLPASPAEKRDRGPAPNLVASLRAVVSAFLSSPECGIFLDFNALLHTKDDRGRMVPRVEAEAELDSLIYCLLRAASNSPDGGTDANAEEQCLQTLQYISQHRSTVYASIPALVQALKSGLIDGASVGGGGGEETTAIQALMTKKRTKKKPVVAPAQKQAIAAPAMPASSNVHADLDSKKARLALLAFLTQGGPGAPGGNGGGGGLIQPRPEPAALYAEILALGNAGAIPSDTLDKLRRIERENHAAISANNKPPHPVFQNFGEALAYTESMPSAADGAGEASTKASVHAFLSSPACLLFGAPRSSPSTAAAGGLTSPAASPGLKLTPAQTSRLIEEGGAGALTLQHLRSMESEGLVFPSVDEMITALQTRHIEHLLKKQRNTLGAAYPLGAYQGGVSIETAIEMDAAAAASGRSLGAAQVALNMQRRAVWDFLHDVSCVLVPPHYPWSIAEVEQMVDTLLPLCAATAGSTVVAMLQEENARLESRAAEPYASSTLLIDALLNARHSLVPSASTASLSADLDGELHANIAEFLSVAGRSLLHGLELFDEDISELVAAGGPDCLLFLWELHEADRSFQCVNPDLTSALARKRLDQSQQEKSWARVVLLRLKKEAATLFGGFEAQKRVLDDLTLARIESLAILRGQEDEPDIAAHPAIVLTHLDSLIYHAGVTHKLYGSFGELEGTLHAGLRSEMMLQAAVVDYLSSVPGLFKRPASHVTATQVAQLFEWSRGGHRMLEYLTALCGRGAEQPPWTLFSFFHDLTHAVRSVHAGMKSAYARGDAQLQWNETPFSGAFPLAPDSLPQAVYYPRFNAERFETMSGPEKRMAWARTSSRPQRHVEQRARRMDAGTRFWRERFEEFEAEAHMPSDECVLSSGVRASRAQPPAWLAAEREASANLLLLLDPFPSGDLPLPPHLRPEPALLANVRVSPSIRAQQDALPASAWWDPLESAAAREARTFKRLQAAQGPNGPQLRLGRISGLQRMQLSRIEDHNREIHMTTAADVQPVVHMKPEVELMSEVLVSPSRLVFVPPAAAAASASASSTTEKTALITRRFLVRNDDLETTFLAQLTLDGDGKYTVTSANPQYLAPGGTASFIVEYDPDRSSAPPDWDKTASVIPMGAPLAAVGLRVETGDSVEVPGAPKRAPMPGESTIRLHLKPVLDDEPLHFTAEDLWALNPHRIAQTGAVARCMMDRTGGAAAKSKRQQAKASAPVAASTTLGSPASTTASPASVVTAAEPASAVAASKAAPNPEAEIEAARSSGVAASSVRAPAAAPAEASSDVPSSDDPTQAEIDAVAKKRRAKRMTQAVDIHQIRNSGLLKSKLPPEESTVVAMMAASSASASAAAPGEVVASISQMSPSSPLVASTRRADFAAAAAAAAGAGSDASPPVSTVSASSSSSPLVIAAMDSAFAATDPATKRKMKRATQAISGLAEHVRMAAAAKAAKLAGGGSASAPATARSSFISAEDSSSGDVPVSATQAGMTSSPVSIAAMDSQLATLTAAEKRKAKRSTQSVDPLLAASLLNRKLLNQPANAVNTVASSSSSAASAPAAAPTVPQTAVTAHPSSAVAIAAADESTATAMGAMTPVERRRVNRATTITSDVAPTMSPLRTGRSVASSPEMGPGSSDSPPPALTLGLTAYESQSGAVAVAHADTQVNAMSARERNRSKRMTQALHDASYDPATARAQRIADENDPVLLAKAAAIEREKVRSAMASLRATPRLAAACTPQLPSAADGSWILSELFAAYRCDADRRLKSERENDHDSFPPKSPSAPESTRAMTYFVQGLGSIAVSAPSGLTLHPHNPAPIQIDNVSSAPLVLFALTSDEEYVLHNPTPVFLAPGARFQLHVSCEAPHLPGAELGLVVKSLLPGEQTAAAGPGVSVSASPAAKLFWEKHPYRIMQKVNVPLECVALQRSPRVATQAKQIQLQTHTQAPVFSSPSVSSSGLDEAGRPKRGRSDRVSGSDYMYPGTSKDDQKKAADAAAAAAAAAAAPAAAGVPAP